MSKSSKKYKQELGHNRLESKQSVLEKKLKDLESRNWIEIALMIFGAMLSLATFILGLTDRIHSSIVLRAFSALGYAIILAGAIRIAFFTRNKEIGWQKTSLMGYAAVTGLYFLWVGTWIFPIAPKPRIIDNMEGTSIWGPYKSNNISSIERNLDQGKEGNALRADFNVNSFGYVGVGREINPQMLAGTQSIGFTYKGTGAPNTIEFKFTYQRNSEGKEPVFGVLWNRASNKSDWTILQAPYSLFTCWPNTGCKVGDVLDIHQVVRIDIAISNKSGDQAGSGTVWLDEIIAFP